MHDIFVLYFSSDFCRIYSGFVYNLFKRHHCCSVLLFSFFFACRKKTHYIHIHQSVEKNPEQKEKVVNTYHCLFPSIFFLTSTQSMCSVYDCNNVPYMTKWQNKEFFVYSVSVDINKQSPCKNLKEKSVRSMSKQRNFWVTTIYLWGDGKMFSIPLF